MTPHRPRPPATPALDRWRREMVTGQRTSLTLDALWKAACCEVRAIEAHAYGLIEAAQRDLTAADRAVKGGAA